MKQQTHLCKLGDFVCLRPFLALDNFKLHCVTFLQCLEAIHADSRVVDENVWPTILADEAVALRVIEPLGSEKKNAGSHSGLPALSQELVLCQLIDRSYSPRLISILRPLRLSRKIRGRLP